MAKSRWSRRELLKLLLGVPLLACTHTKGKLSGGATDADPGDAAAPGDAAPEPDAISHVCADSYPRIDLVIDCQAAGDGVTDDTPALQKAADILNAAGGGELTIPPGTYLVGKQAPDPAGPYYKPEPMFAVSGLGCLLIRGHGAILKIAAGLHYGGFDTNGQPVDVVGRDQLRAAHVGRVLDLVDCDSVTIEGLEIDGNAGALVLGGSWGDVDRQTSATGIGLNRCSNVQIVDVHVHHHGLDGITILHTDSAITGPKPHALVRVVSEYNGRQGLSWISGWGLTCTDCKFNHTGRTINGDTPLSSKPGAGVDIEPNPGTGDRTRAGLFDHCELANNAGPGILTAGGDSGHARFVGCAFWGTTTYSLWPAHPGLEFESCEIHGTAVHASDGRATANGAPDAALATRFTSCTFEDIPWTDGRVFRSGNLYNLPDARPGVTWKDCTFVNHGVRAVSIANATTREVFDGCTFRMSNAALANGSQQASFAGSAITSCVFTPSAGVIASGRTYFIDVTNVTVIASATPTHVDGPHLQWNSATNGIDGDIPPGTYA